MTYEDRIIAPGSKFVLDGDPERTRGRKYHRSYSNTFDVATVSRNQAGDTVLDG